MSRRLVVLELNEVPLRVLTHAAGRHRNLARLLRASEIRTSVLSDELPREPYPSQSWATLGTGAPWAEHGIWWYNDPKPAAYPFYWELAARGGRSVGVVNTLHACPIEGRLDHPGVRFVVPDVFAPETRTVPADLVHFQELVQELTNRNARTSSLRIDLETARRVGSLTGIGLRPGTVAEIGRLVAGVATGRHPTERLRLGPFLLHGDLFAGLVRQHDPDLAVLFSNHVASAMHRYWYAAFPEDFDEAHYDEAWVERYADEIDAAMRLVDRFLGWLLPYAEDTDRVIAVVSSMGQAADTRLDTSRTRESVLADPERLLELLGVEDPYEIRAAMHPQLTLEFADEMAAARAARVLEPARFDTIDHQLDRRGRTVTLTEVPTVLDDGTLEFDGRRVEPDTVGYVARPVDDHSSGRHHREGSFLLAGPGVTPGIREPIDVTDIAPRLLDLLGVDPVTALATTSTAATSTATTRDR